MPRLQRFFDANPDYFLAVNGVIAGNEQAELSWASAGFVEVRRREGIAMGRKVNTVRVMMKPLAGGTAQDYLARVARDRPESP